MRFVDVFILNHFLIVSFNLNNNFIKSWRHDVFNFTSFDRTSTSKTTNRTLSTAIFCRRRRFLISIVNASGNTRFTLECESPCRLLLLISFFPLPVRFMWYSRVHYTSTVNNNNWSRRDCYRHGRVCFPTIIVRFGAADGVANSTHGVSVRIRGSRVLISCFFVLSSPEFAKGVLTNEQKFLFFFW